MAITNKLWSSAKAITPAKTTTKTTSTPSSSATAKNTLTSWLGSGLAGQVMQSDAYKTYMSGGGSSGFKTLTQSLTGGVPKSTMYASATTTSAPRTGGGYLGWFGGKSQMKTTTIPEEDKKKEEIKQTKEIKQLAQEVKPMPGFEFIGYDEQGRPQYRDTEAYFAEQNPWLDKNMNYKKNYNFTSEEEIMANITDPYAQQYYIGKLKGFDVSDWAISEDEALQLFQKEQQKEKSLLESQIATKTAETQKQSREQQAGVQEAFAQSREGVISEGNVLASQNIRGAISSQARQYIEQMNLQAQELDKLQEQQLKEYSSSRADRILTLQAQIQEAQAAAIEAENAQREQTMSYLEMMQDSGALAYADEETLSYLAEGLPGAPAGFINMLANAATRTALNEDMQQRFDNQQSAITTMKSLADAGMYLTPELVAQYSQATGLPFETIFAFNENVERIRQDKEMDSAKKMMEMQKLGYELDRESRGIVTSQLQNIDYLTDLYRKGASQEEIAFVKQALGIKDMDDPMYRLEYEGLQLKNQAQGIANAYLPSEKQLNLENASLDNSIKQIEGLMKSEDWKNYPEEIKLKLEKMRVDMRTANEEIKKTFGTPVFVNQGGKYQVDQTQDGIRVVAKNGDVGGQCGRFVNNYLGTPSFMKNSYEEKMAVMDPSITEGSPGMVFVMPYKDTGHTGIIERAFYDKQGRLQYEVVDSNWGLDEKIKRHIIAADRVTGYLIPDNAVSGTVKAPATPAEKLTAMENRLPDAYKWIGTSMVVAYPDKAEAQLENVVNLVEQGRGQEAKTLVYTAIMNKAPADKVAGLKNTIDQFQALESELKNFEAWAQSVSYDPNIASKSFDDIAKALKKKRPKEYVAFERRVNEAFAEYLKVLSGTAVSESEAKRIKELFGDPTKPLLENKIAMKQLNEKSMMEMDNFISAYSNGQFDSYQSLNEALEGISSLKASDLKVSDYGTYKPGDVYTITKKNPDSYSYWLDQSTSSIDQTLLNRY